MDIEQKSKYLPTKSNGNLSEQHNNGDKQPIYYGKIVNSP